MKLECKNCKKTKTENDFRYTIKNGRLYFTTSKCKECFKIGKRSYQLKNENKIDFTKVILNDNLNRKSFGLTNINELVRKNLHYLLLKIKLNNGNVTELDCFNIISLYVDIFGDISTVKNEEMQLNNEFEILFYYKKLQEVYERARVIEEV